MLSEKQFLWLFTLFVALFYAYIIIKARHEINAQQSEKEVKK